MKDNTKSWLEFAGKDLQGAKKLLDGNGLENLVLFHCQQTIEKVLKAILAEYNVRAPKIHGTRTLYELVISNIPSNMKIDENILLEIDSIYIDSRYPIELGILPSGFPTQDEAKRIFYETEKLFEIFKNLLD